FEVGGGLAQDALHVWRSDAKEQFVRLADIQPSGGTFTLSADPGSIYSLTTTTGQARGSASPPPAKPFPALVEDFESYAIGATPRYFADQFGAFEVVERDKGKALRQVIPTRGIEWGGHKNPEPGTFLGDLGWRDYAVSVDALIEGAGAVSLFGRVGQIPKTDAAPDAFRLELKDTGAWALRTARTAIASGTEPIA